MPALARLAAALAPLALASCAPVLSTMTPARTTPARHVRAALGVGIGVPTGTLVTLLDDAGELADRAASGGTLTDDEKRTLLSDTAAVLFNPPSVAAEVQGRYGISDRLDLGLRFATGAIRLDGRFLVLPPQAGRVAVSVGLGLGYYALEIPVPAPLDQVVEIDDFTRFELDVPVLVGWTWRFGHLWLGPKLVFTSYGTAMRAAFPFDGSRLGADVSGTSVYYGAQVGGAIGYAHVWVAAELTLMGVSGHAELEGVGAPLEASFGDFVLYPAVAVLVEL